jgi:hypothetical protein
LDDRVDKVLVSVADDHLDKVSTVLTGLRQVGLVVDAVHAELGTVTGSIAPDRFNRLRTVPGVAVVERQRGVQIAPPDSDLQ